MKDVWKNLVLLFITLLLCFGIAEVITRMTISLYPLYFVNDPLVGKIHQRGLDEIRVEPEFKVHIKTNSAGFVDKERTLAKPDGVIRIAVLGDSFVESLHVDFGSSFTALLEDKLNARVDGHRYEVLNFGVGGFGTAQETLLLERVLAYNPDLVLVAFHTNDVKNNKRELESDGLYRPFFELEDGALVLTQSAEVAQPLWKRLMVRSHFVVWAYQTVFVVDKREQVLEGGYPADLDVYRSDDLPLWNDAWNITFALLDQMKATTQRDHVRFALVDIPASIEVYPELSAETLEYYPEMSQHTFDWDKQVKTITMYAQTNNVSLYLLPLRAHVQSTGEDLYYPVDRHLNERGHVVASEMLYGWLIDERVLG